MAEQWFDTDPDLNDTKTKTWHRDSSETASDFFCVSVSLSLTHSSIIRVAYSGIVGGLQAY